MTGERLQRGIELAKKIDDVNSWLTTCNIMLEHHHNNLKVTGNMTFNVPDDIANGILQLSKDALERQLAGLQKQFEEL